MDLIPIAQRLARRRRRSVRIDVAALVFGAVGFCVQLYRGYDWVALIHVVSFLSFAFMIFDDMDKAATADRLLELALKQAQLDALDRYNVWWRTKVLDAESTEVRGREADIVLVDDMVIDAPGRPVHDHGRWGSA